MKKVLLLTVVGTLCLGLVKLASAQELPPECYRNGYVDLQTCWPHQFWNIPLSELERGYYGVFGTFIPRLPYQRMHTFAPSHHLVGNAARYNPELMEFMFNRRTEQWQLDSSHYLGGIATDSCGYMQSSVWVKVPGANHYMGPFLVVDCRALIHKFEIACAYGTVIEMMYEPFGLETETGLIHEVEVYVAAPRDLRPPPASLPPPVPYAEAWLEEADMSC